eukprot:superscaffoldBa00005776_g20768
MQSRDTRERLAALQGLADAGVNHGGRGQQEKNDPDDDSESPPPHFHLNMLPTQLANKLPDSFFFLKAGQVAAGGADGSGGKSGPFKTDYVTRFTPSLQTLDPTPDLLRHLRKLLYDMWTTCCHAPSSLMPGSLMSVRCVR